MSVQTDAQDVKEVKEQPKEDADSDDDDEPEANLQEHFWKNLGKSAVLLVLGTAVVAVFSDPMVDVIGDFGNSINVSPFYVSFLITPYCSNASEVISSLIFAMKKKKENTSMTYSQLYGAACMNNTLCLGLFFFLVYFRKLAWAFTAETISILFVTWAVGIIASIRNTFPVWASIPVLLLYPGSLVLVWVLEYVADWT